jgi:hypothetical protein
MITAEIINLQHLSSYAGYKHGNDWIHRKGLAVVDEIKILIALSAALKVEPVACSYQKCITLMWLLKGNLLACIKEIKTYIHLKSWSVLLKFFKSSNRT